MTDPRRNGRLKPLRTCFLRGDASPENETRVTVIGHNSAHEQRIVQDLISFYGWKLGHDGTLYPSIPVQRGYAA